MVRQGRVSKESVAEQTSAGLLSLTDEQAKNIHSLGSSYRQKFKIHFVICARENKVDAILEGLESRLGNTEEEELEIAIGELVKICGYRIYNLVQVQAGDLPSKL